jgi:hypothetical protein
MPAKIRAQSPDQRHVEAYSGLRVGMVLHERHSRTTGAGAPRSSIETHGAASRLQWHARCPLAAGLARL